MPPILASVRKARIRPRAMASTTGDDEGNGRTARRRDRRRRPATAGCAVATHLMGDGRHPIRHDHVVFDADSDHAAVFAGSRRAIGKCGRFVGGDPRRRHLVCRGVRVTVVGTPRRPARAQIDAAPVERCCRAVCRADGCGEQCLAAFRVSRADGGLCRFFEHRDRSGSGSGARGPPRLRARLAQHRPARRLAGRPFAWRRAGRCDRQLPHPVLLHFGDDPVVDELCLVRRPRALCPCPARARPPGNAQQPHRGGALAGAVGIVLRAVDGAVRGAHGAAGGNLVRQADARARGPISPH